MKKVCLKKKKKKREYQLYIFLTTLKTANQQTIFTKVQVSLSVTLIRFLLMYQHVCRQYFHVTGATDKCNHFTCC